MPIIKKNRKGNYNGKPASITSRKMTRAYRDNVDADAVKVLSAPKDNRGIFFKSVLIGKSAKHLYFLNIVDNVNTSL